MYGIPEDLNISELVGQPLDLISFSANTVHFVFGNEISITVESSYSYKIGEGDVVKQEKIPIKSSSLMNLVGSYIKSVNIKNSNELLLKFDKNSFLLIYDDNETYESFQIQIKDKNIIV